MKKIVTTAFVSLQVLLAGAQQNIINGSFEDTVIINNPTLGIYDTIPADWTTSDFGSGITSDAVTGSTAAYIWNWYYYAKGTLTNGDADFPAKGGSPINFRPDVLTGSYKYIVGDVQSIADSGVAMVCLTRFNTNTNLRDTIGFGLKRLGPENTYKTFEVEVNYRSAEQPDTVTVSFLSSENGFCSNASDGNCLFLYIDDVTLSSSTGVSESLTMSNTSFYPNPVSDVLNVHVPGSGEVLIEIISAQGKLVMSKLVRGATATPVDMSILENGIYFVKAGGGTGTKIVKQ